VECLQAGKQLIAQHQDVESHWHEVLNGMQPAIESCNIRCFDAAGRLVLQTRLSQGDFFRSEQHNAASGIYLFEMTSASERYALRKIIE
jgi:hypothetical protein